MHQTISAPTIKKGNHTNYLLALRNKDISIGLTTWYKYSKLLGHSTSRHLQTKINIPRS
jgi:hypothetical protein